LPKELKPELKRHGIYIATMLYIWKASLPYDVPYESEVRHRVCWASNGGYVIGIANRPYNLYLDSLHMSNMVAMAKNMTVAPPIALLKKVSVSGGTEVYFNKTAALIHQASNQQVQVSVNVLDSYDIADRALTYKWTVLYGNKNSTVVDQGSGNYLITVPSDTNLPAGRTTIILTVNNGIYDSNPAAVNIYRPDGAVNKRPLISGISNKTIFPGDTVTFNLTGTDPEGFPCVFYKRTQDPGILAGNLYTWTTTSGTTPGVYSVGIICSDGTTGINSTEAAITVANTIARVSADVTTGTVPLTVRFSSLGSADSSGNGLAYSWKFDDGATSTNAHPTHIYSTPGFYHAELTVTGPLGSSTAELVVEAKQSNWVLDIDNGWSTGGLDTAVWSVINPTNGTMNFSNGKLNLGVTANPYGIQSVKSFGPPFYFEADFGNYWANDNDCFHILGNALGGVFYNTMSYRNLSAGDPVNIGDIMTNERVVFRVHVMNDPNNPGKVRYTGYLDSSLQSYCFRIDNQTFTPDTIQFIKTGFSADLWRIQVWAPASSTNQVTPPVISIAPQSNQPGIIELSWSSSTGAVYAVYKTTNLLMGWPAQAFTNISGDGALKVFSEQIGAAQAAFYRIKATPGN
jgi:PKD repeat protein